MILSIISNIEYANITAPIVTIIVPELLIINKPHNTIIIAIIKLYIQIFESITTDHASGSWDDAGLEARSVHGTHSSQNSAVRQPIGTLESVLSVGKFGCSSVSLGSFIWLHHTRLIYVCKFAGCMKSASNVLLTHFP